MSFLIDMVKNHPWNNIIRVRTSEVINHILDSDKKEMVEMMFSKCNLIAILIQLSDVTDFSYPSSNTTHQGYIGFLIEVANKIIKC